MHAKEPLTKPELVEHMMKKLSKTVKMSDKFKVKRSGKDENDIYYSFGKVHGLENIAFVDDETIAACEGNPVKLQKAVYAVKPDDIKGFASSEQLETERDAILAKYKSVISGMSVHSSDRKKLNALPFALSKRSEDPTPKVGQSETQLFEEIFGRPWTFGEELKFDSEEKITEFNFEEYIPQEILSKYDTSSDDF